MNTASWAGVAVASLVGSAHCATMCGPFVAAYASGEQEPRARRALSHLAYNGGRLLTYLMLGATAGALGHALDLAGHAAGLADAAGIVTGVLLLFWGARGLVPRASLVPLGRSSSKNLVSRWVSGVFASFAEKPALMRAGLLGLSTTLLPCGWLYAFVALASATGSAAQGAWSMSAFWVGSLPMMLGVGWSLQGFAGRLQRRVPRLRSALVLGVGVVTLLLRFQSPALAAKAPSAPAAGVSALPHGVDCPLHAKLRVSHSEAP